MIASLLVLSGCKKAVDAPPNLEDLMVFGFDHSDEDDSYREATVQGLIPAVKKHLAEMADGYQVSSLKASDLQDAGVADPPDVTAIIGAMGEVDYTHGLDDVVAVTSNEHKDKLFANFLEYEIKDTTDRDCFLSHDCDSLDQTVHEKTHVDFVGDADRTYTNHYWWVDDPDLPPAVIIQQLNPTEVDFTGSALNLKVFQQYEYVVIWQDGDTAKRADAFWVDFKVLGISVPDNFAVKNAVGQMGTQAENIDTYLDDPSSAPIE